MIFRFLFSFSLLFSYLFAQTDTLKIIPLAYPADEISFDPEGNVWVLFTSKNQLSRWLKSSHYDSLQTIGGQGLQAEALSFPTDLRVYARNQIYLSDQNDNRILLINNNLKPIRSISVGDIGNPDLSRFQSFTCHIQSLYILAQNTNKIFKINEFSKIEMEFGGWDTGNMVENPVEILSDQKSQLFVIDTLNQEISLFSAYGAWEDNIQLQLPFRWNKIKVNQEYLLAFHTNYNQLAIYQIPTKITRILSLPTAFKDIDLNTFNKEVVLLEKDKWVLRTLE